MPQTLKRFPSKMDPKAERSRSHLSRDPKGSGPNSNVCQEGAGVSQHQGILGHQQGVLQFSSDTIYLERVSEPSLRLSLTGQSPHPCQSQSSGCYLYF